MVQFLIELYAFFLVNYRTYLYNLETILCYTYILQIHPSLGLPFHFLNTVFWRAEVFNFDGSLSYLFISFSFIANVYCVLTNLCSHQHHEDYSSTFSPRSFKFLTFLFRNVICWILFLIWCEARVKVQFFPYWDPCITALFVERTILFLNKLTT